SSFCLPISVRWFISRRSSSKKERYCSYGIALQLLLSNQQHPGRNLAGVRLIRSFADLSLQLLELPARGACAHFPGNLPHQLPYCFLFALRTLRKLKQIVMKPFLSNPLRSGGYAFLRS